MDSDPKEAEFLESRAAPKLIIKYLNLHPELLESYLIENVEVEQLEKCLIRATQRAKKQHTANRKTSLSRWKFCVHADKRAMLQELTALLQQSPSESRLLHELSRCICSAVDADGYTLYLNDSSTSQLREDPDLPQLNNRWKKEESKGDAMEIAREVGEKRRLSRINIGEPAPHWMSQQNYQLQDGVKSSLFEPLMRTDGELMGVIQLWRARGHHSFHEEDEEIVDSYLVWGGVAFHYAHLYAALNTQKQLHEFLLQVTRSIFQDMVSTDALVVKIMESAQHLVQADRASLFLVDPSTNELYARIFDSGAITSTQVRFPVGIGIAGYVAKTGQLLNIADVYSDSRFNRNVDQITGYKTQSILSMPIFLPPRMVIGVVQMVNKRDGHFTKVQLSNIVNTKEWKTGIRLLHIVTYLTFCFLQVLWDHLIMEDEKAFEMFAVYCGLALHHARLFEKIKRSEQKYQVALEVLSYHSTCSDDEILQVLPLPEEIQDINNFQLNPLDVDELEKVRWTLYMFRELFGNSRFEMDEMIRFTMTVRKNYRRVPYHNWSHGFTVAHSMFTILQHSNQVFTQNESLALFIASLCHDLDHRGKSNKFMLESASPLANMYTTSTMEHHHFNQTVAILQQDGHNFLQKLEREEFRQVLSIIKHCILATDLERFFKNKATLSRIIEKETFDWANLQHRCLVQAVAMTASDLSASTKPWEIQLQTVKVIFQEFYEQGDEERRAGREPLQMMDRLQPEQQSSSQVGFLSIICIPCYKLLAYLIPGTEPLLQGCEKNLVKWKELHDSGQKHDVLEISQNISTL